MKICRIILVFVVVVGLVYAKENIVNGDFEASPWDTGWDNSSGIASDESGVNRIHGAHSAKMIYNQTGNLVQNFDLDIVDFNMEFYFKHLGVVNGRGMNLHLDKYGGSIAVNMRVLLAGTDGVDDALQVYGGGAWQTISAADFFDSTTQAYRIRIEGRNWGTANAEYSVYWSGAGSSDLIYSAKGLTYYQFAPTADEFSRIKFAKPSVTTNSWIVDDVSIHRHQYGMVFFIR